MMVNDAFMEIARKPKAIDIKGMTREEAIEILSRPKSMKDVPDEILMAHAMAIQALELEQRILDNGYTGKEAEFRIGGRLFGIREKAQ